MNQALTKYAEIYVQESSLWKYTARWINEYCYRGYDKG